MSSHTYIHTHTHDNYYNPRCAHAHRGLIINPRCACAQRGLLASERASLLSCKLRFAIYIYIYIFSYVRQNFDLHMLSFTRIARGNFRIYSTCNRYFKDYRYRYVWGYG